LEEITIMAIKATPSELKKLQKKSAKQRISSLPEEEKSLVNKLLQRTCKIEKKLKKIEREINANTHRTTKLWSIEIERGVNNNN
jgi:hypothetical protein